MESPTQITREGFLSWVEENKRELEEDMADTQGMLDEDYAEALSML